MSGTFAPIEAFARLMADFPRPWFVSGGWAIDLFLDCITRDHEDVEVGIFRDDQGVLYQHLAGWQLHKAVPGPNGGAWVPWEAGERLALPLFQILALPPAGAPRDPPECEFFLNEVADGAWRFRRNPAITRSLATLTRRSARGIPIIAPEVQLLHKAKHHRPKDDHDFHAALGSLSDAQRAWLKSALLRNPPDDPWLAEL